jgi:hypothetical protein
MANLSPDEREQMVQRMRARGNSAADSVGSGRGGGTGDGRGRAGAAAPRTPGPASTAGATTIDALFGPLPAVESVGRVFVYVDQQLRPVRVRLGITDGQMTALLEGDLQEGTEVVTNVTTGTEATRPATTAFPFGMGPQGGRGGGGSNRGGGGGRGF